VENKQVMKEEAVLQLLTSPDSRLLITTSGYLGAILRFVPLDKMDDDDIPTYKDKVSEELSHYYPIAKNEGVSLSDDFGSGELTPGTLAYHRIQGLITSSSHYRFSSKWFENDLLLAENNPNIYAHFVHITSGGGEAWYLDRLSETINSLVKPFYVLIEKECASAAYYIACHGTVIKALTQNDLIGCIGVMISFWDLTSYFESLGFRKIEEYAHKSDLKNKKYNDLMNGKPKQYIEEELDPLQIQFENEVRRRKQLAALPERHPVVRGETYSANEAIPVGLIDGITTFLDAVKEGYELGQRWANTRSKNRNKILSYI
jgi:ClpP class serine protease